MKDFEQTLPPATTGFFENRISTLFDTLQREYQNIRPESDAHDFRLRIYDRLIEYTLKNPYKLVSREGSISKEVIGDLIAQGEKTPIPISLWQIYFACAVGIASGFAHSRKEFESAWDNLAEASFWLGFVVSTSRGEEIADTMLGKKALQKRSRSGTDVLHEETRKNMQWAYEYVRDEGAKRAWPSQAAAAAAIEIELKNKLAEDYYGNWSTTIKGWLRKMEDGEKWFPNFGAKGK